VRPHLAISRTCWSAFFRFPTTAGRILAFRFKVGSNEAYLRIWIFASIRHFARLYPESRENGGSYWCWRSLRCHPVVTWHVTMNHVRGWVGFEFEDPPEVLSGYPQVDVNQLCQDEELMYWLVLNMSNRIRWLIEGVEIGSAI
jgi:hypothetical protein